MKKSLICAALLAACLMVPVEPARAGTERHAVTVSQGVGFWTNATPSGTPSEPVFVPTHLIVPGTVATTSAVTTVVIAGVHTNGLGAAKTVAANDRLVQLGTNMVPLLEGDIVRMTSSYTNESGTGYVIGQRRQP
jgi:hypothetical protein